MSTPQANPPRAADVDPGVLSPVPARRHDLDALRAGAMLLGIGLHAALSYIAMPGWPVQDGSASPVLGEVVSAIHGFRMPLFFVMSGFFTAMLWRRRGLGGLIRQRTMRIALPLSIGCATIVPVMWALAIGANILGFNLAPQHGPPPTPDADIWTAAAMGDLDAIDAHIQNGAELNTPDPIRGTTPIAWSAIGNHPDATRALLDAGADPNAADAQKNAALHTAAFFGRDEIVRILLDAGADPNVRNLNGESPLDSAHHPAPVVNYIAGLLGVTVDTDEVMAGREQLLPMLEAAVSASTSNDAQEPAASNARSSLKTMLFDFPFFFHLWFLWHLCLLVVLFALATPVLRLLDRLPAALVGSPLAIVWLVPITLVPQLFMHNHGAMPGFGADTSSGLVPLPQVFAYYAVFFFFGSILYTATGAVDRFGRWWLLTLPAALVLLPFAMGLGFQKPWAAEAIADEATRRVVAAAAQSLYAWLMIFGLAGLCRTLLKRERPWVRYLSDSSYWLYLVHLPLVLVAQAGLRMLDLPLWLELAAQITVITAVLLASYHLFVRYTIIGRTLNGPRTRPTTKQAHGTAVGSSSAP